MSTSPTILEVGGTTEIITVGTQGPEGPPGESLIGGYFVTVTDIANNDLIRFDTAQQKWINIKQSEVLNGGNF